VQTAGEAVVLVGELRAGVQAREDDLDARDAFLRVLVDRHAAAVVLHRQRPVLVQRDRDLVRVPGDGLVGGVVDDFLREVVRALGRRVHAGALAHRLQSGQDFDG
jgi:hypothetical protein